MASQQDDAFFPDEPAPFQHGLQDSRADHATVMVLAAKPGLCGQICEILEDRGFLPQVIADVGSLWKIGLPSTPACLLCSHPLPDGITGFAILSEIRQRNWLLPTVLIASEWDVPQVVRAMRGGADNFLTLPLHASQLLEAVSHALGEAHQQFAHASAIADAKERAATLDSRELQVVKLVLRGLLNKEIADELKLALVTIKVYRGRAMKKLGAGNAAELARIASLAGMGDDTVT